MGQRASKVLRFSGEEVQPGQDLDNYERLREEYVQLLAVMAMVVNEGYIRAVDRDEDGPAMLRKVATVEKFLLYSKERGTLQD